MFSEDNDEYQFDWCMIGDIEDGRPTLGMDMPVAVYRLLQFSLRCALIREYGLEAADRVFYMAGKRAGQEFFRVNLVECESFEELVKKIEELFLTLKIGIFRVESANLEKNEFVFTVGEDLDCSGLPASDETICTYDEGMIAGILYAFTGKDFTVREIDCWCSGDRICRFEVKAIQ